MNEQRVELFIKDRKFSFMIPFNDYVPFKKAEKKIIDLIENIEHTEELFCMFNVFNQIYNFLFSFFKRYIIIKWDHERKLSIFNEKLNSLLIHPKDFPPSILIFLPVI